MLYRFVGGPWQGETHWIEKDLAPMDEWKVRYLNTRPLDDDLLNTGYNALDRLAEVEPRTAVYRLTAPGILQYIPETEEPAPQEPKNMTQESQTNAFANDLDFLVERYRKEFDLTYASIVGCLTIAAHQFASEAIEDTDDDAGTP